jgi:arylsulfatase
VIFLTDDSGFSNLETFGGPVHSPTMTRIRERGIAYNRFHTTAMCSPTRAALLTGRNHHRVGAGVIAEFANDFDGYVGELPRSSATVARVLRDYGYDTVAFGKWHNTPITALTPAGPFDQYPTGLGFNHFYGFIAGETSQYEPRLFENTNPVEPPGGDGYHLTEDLADRAIGYIRTNRALNPDRPLFLYFAPGAVHGPHHVSSEWADRYAGRFDAGWEALREETFQRQKSRGWIPEEAELTPIQDGMQRWEDVPEDQRAFQTRLMEVYAGFLEHTDVQYGRIVDELEAQGMLDNTLLLYIGSDNGASAEGQAGTISELLAQNLLSTTVEEQIEVLERDYGGLAALGSPLVDSMYHHGWAWAGDTPFKSTKLVAAHFGGTRTPLVISWPAQISPDATPRSQFHHVNDIAATIYDVVGIEPPHAVDGVEQDPLDGVSFAYTFDDVDASGRKRTQYFDIYGSRGVYDDGWFACTFGPRMPWQRMGAKLSEWDPDQDVWELYDLTNDFSQSNDLSEQQPSRLQALKDRFTMEATDNKVFPIGAAFYTSVLHPEELRASRLREWTLFPGQTRIPESSAPKFTGGHSSQATVDVDIADGASGVLFCVGGLAGGFTVYMNEGEFRAEYNTLGVYRYKASSNGPIPTGKQQLGVRLAFDEANSRSPATLSLEVGGIEVGSCRVERPVPAGFTASETFDVGCDLGSAVSLDYHERAPFPFMGTIERVHVRYV